MRTVLKWVQCALAGMVDRIVERDYGGFRVYEARDNGVKGLDCLKVILNNGLLIWMAERAEVKSNSKLKIQCGRGQRLKDDRERSGCDAAQSGLRSRQEDARNQCRC